jgi:magnesium and cobalt transporter
MHSIKNLLKVLTLGCTKMLISLWFWLTGKDPGGAMRETIYELIEQDEKDSKKAIDVDERVLLSNILDLKEEFVSSVMIPRAQILGIDKKNLVEDAISLMIKSNTNRLIIFDGNMDQIVGYTSIIDCLRNNKKSLTDLAHQLDAISPRMSILDLLMKMKHTGEKLILVLDDHGGIEGIVAFNDLIQKIIGNIESDSHLSPPGRITIRDNGEIVVDGHVDLEELEEELELKFVIADDIEVHTIAGYICAHLGRLPSRGELISHPDGRDYLILDASPRKIKRVCIRIKEIT